MQIKQLFFGICFLSSQCNDTKIELMIDLGNLDRLGTKSRDNHKQEGSIKLLKRLKNKI